MSRHIPARSRLISGLVISMLALGMFPLAAQAATPPIRFTLSYGDDCISGTANSGTVAVTWRSAGGALKAAGAIPESGYWELCSSGSDPAYVEIGDKIKADDGTYARNYVVPELNVIADRVGDTFYGTGPAGRTITLWYPAGTFADYGYTHYVRVGSDGHWSYTPNDISDIIGGWFAELDWKSPNDDRLTDYTNAPAVALTLGKARFAGSTEGGRTVTLALRDANSNERLARATATTAPEFGDFFATFRDSNGNAVKVMPGQRFKSLSLAADANWIVPNIEATADTDADTVSGRCYDAGTSSGSLAVFVSRDGHQRGYYLFGQVDDAAGNFTVDFSDSHASPGYDPVNIQPGDELSVTCRQTTGDSVGASFVAP
jgi:hypothetical protein